ncbi:unnamed protein product [Leptidea sinapis]|uniref:Bacterial transcriptional activator domain-containing protein n=1 Tax=Leptidea sinapis TaxID=189913 RepID=A0A5E4R5P5_9NEOP|nr:unnamed protein product [Leptidea sinapis]
MLVCGGVRRLIELARKMDKGSSESLRHLAEALVAAGELTTAADLYQRLGDYSFRARSRSSRMQERHRSPRAHHTGAGRAV